LTVVCVLGRNLLFEEVDILKSDDLKIYRYAIVGLEVLSFIVMCLSLKFMNKTIDVFSLNEFDLIRNNFTDDFISKV
jgi:hypothetical protein